MCNHSTSSSFSLSKFDKNQMKKKKDSHLNIEGTFVCRLALLNVFPTHHTQRDTHYTVHIRIMRVYSSSY